jgi:pimeloyl-ACP methyl ester carboxylesterase
VGKLFRVMSAAASAAGLVTYARYRREMRAIRAAVDGGGTIAQTAAGAVEYAESGEGEPMLVIHGAGGGYVQGLLVARDLGEGFRKVAPSRFGYLKTPVPDDPSPAAQADAHAALLDRLGIPKSVVVGVSAGGPSAIELALRHSERVSALILLVPRTYDPTQSVGVDQSMPSQAVLRLIEASADFLFWLATRVARGSIVRFLGVPPEVEAAASSEDRERVTEVMRSVLPLSERVRGIAVDSSVEISPWPLERIGAPTLIVSAKDDLFRTLPGARFTAEHIAGAQLHVLESGGHLMVGRSRQVREWVQDFLRSRRPGARKGSERAAVALAAEREREPA